MKRNSQASFTYRKHLGDDRYSWAVFKDGVPIMTGLSRSEAQHQVKYLKEKK